MSAVAADEHLNRRLHPPENDMVLIALIESTAGAHRTVALASGLDAEASRTIAQDMRKLFETRAAEFCLWLDQLGVPMNRDIRVSWELCQSAEAPEVTSMHPRDAAILLFHLQMQKKALHVLSCWFPFN